MMEQCKTCQVNFEITDLDLKFYEKVSPVFKTTEGLSLQLKIPPPTLCPDCRQQRRLSFRNERNLYKRKCDLCKKDIISIYSPDKRYIVYCSDCWWGDKWDFLEYGKNYDFNKSFFEQFNKLMLLVPRLSIINRNSQNSEYTNICEKNKNCYLLIESSDNEDCLYSYWLQKSKNCIDCSFCNECILVYESDNCENCYNLKFSQNCQNCIDSYFLQNCIACKNCFGCINLRQKEFYIFNKVYSKKEYFIKLNELLNKNFHDFQNTKNDIFQFFDKYPRKFAQIIQSENCSGDYISNSKECLECFHAQEAEYCKYSTHIWRNSKFIFDCDTVGMNSELAYECINTAINSYNNKFCNRCWTVTDSFYSNDCDNSINLFGCVSLRHKQYCILNKQYTKEEYEKLVPKIIEAMKSPKSPLTRGLGHPLDKGGLGDCEWGEFFPSSISPFGYNETVAQEYFPLTKEQALRSTRGCNPLFKWSDYEPEFPHVEKIIPANLLPDNINEIPDDILNWAVECEITKKPFKIIKPELDFYRKMNLPIPRKHPDQRHKDRMALRNPRKLWKRNCIKCNAEIQTTYSHERREIIYCEDCYLKNIY